MKSPVTAHRRFQIAALAYEGANSLDLLGPLEAFSVASRVNARTHPEAAAAYQTVLIGESAGLVGVSGGICLYANLGFDSVEGGFETLLVPGSAEQAGYRNARVVDWLRSCGPRFRRIVGIHSGVLLLAEAGLLDGRRATVHWSLEDEMRAEHPLVELEPDVLFISDGCVVTTAGYSSGVDLALAMIEDDLGRQVSLAAARELVTFLRRPGDHPQISSQLEAQIQDGSGAFEDLQLWVIENLSRDLRVEVLAEKVMMSPRNFARVFLKAVGSTPGRFVEIARLEAARRWIEEADAPLKCIAQQCGFGSVDRMRRAFTKHLNIKPSEYRKLHGGRRPADSIPALTPRPLAAPNVSGGERESRFSNRAGVDTQERFAPVGGDSGSEGSNAAATANRPLSRHQDVAGLRAVLGAAERRAG